MLKQWELELILDLVNDKLEATSSPVWIEQLTDLKQTLLNIEYEEEE